MVAWFAGSVRVRRFCAYAGQPPPFLLQRIVPSAVTQLMVWPVRFFTSVTTRLSTASRSVGRAPAFLSTLSYTALLDVLSTTRPEFHTGRVLVISVGEVSPQGKLTRSVSVLPPVSGA